MISLQFSVKNLRYRDIRIINGCWNESSRFAASIKESIITNISSLFAPECFADFGQVPFENRQNRLPLHDFV